MKILILLLALPLFSNSQINLYNSSLLDTSKKQIYLHSRNEIVIQSKQIIDAVKLDNKEAVKVDKNRFDIYPAENVQGALFLFRKGKLVHKAIFKIDTIAGYFVRIGNFLDNSLTIREITRNPTLNVLYPGTNYSGHLKVWSFQLIIEYSNGDSKDTGASNGNSLTTDQLALISKTNSGDKLNFIEIRGGGPDSRTMKFQAFSVTIH